MSQSNEANDYKIISINTNVQFPDDNIVMFREEKKENRFSKVSYNFFKRAVDITASSIGLLLLSPVLIATGIAIKKDSKGPAIFTQQRIGKDGKLFSLYKFRTMVPDADQKLFEYLATDEKAREEYKINKKLKNDPRVTKIGKMLRSTSIDELPQLLNVLKGDMSLVGPRPYLPREIDDMGNYYDTIIESKPGITGLWQVSGRSNTTFEDRLKFDMEYNEDKGFFYDMGLLTKTVGVVVKKDGAK